MSIVQIDVECTDHFAGVVQPLRHIFFELLTGQLLSTRKYFSEVCGSITVCLADIAAKASSSLEELKILLCQEVVGAAALRDMEHRKASGSFSCFLIVLLLLPDLCADTLILLPRKLAAHLIDGLLQMFFQCFVFQMPVQRIVPTLVNPESDVFAVHCITPISGPLYSISGNCVMRYHTPSFRLAE